MFWKFNTLGKIQVWVLVIEAILCFDNQWPNISEDSIIATYLNNCFFFNLSSRILNKMELYAEREYVKAEFPWLKEKFPPLYITLMLVGTSESTCSELQGPSNHHYLQVFFSGYMPGILKLIEYCDQQNHGPPKMSTSLSLGSMNIYFIQQRTLCCIK